MRIFHISPQDLQDKIKEAIAENAMRFSLDYHGLTALPPELGNIGTLKFLWLNHN